MLHTKKLYSKEQIKRYAFNYLDKFGTSKNYLLKFLIQKMKHRFIVHNDLVLESDVRKIVEELSALGYLNDISFCESRIKSLLKEGNSIFNISIKLKQKNISTEDIELAFDNILENTNNTKEDLELYALLKYAKKRNVLLWQNNNSCNSPNQKEVNTLLRKGFSFTLVEQVINKYNPINNNQDSFEQYLTNIETQHNL